MTTAVALIRQAVQGLRAAVVAVLLLPVHLWRATAVMRQPRCRYYPSCSTYAVGALRVHGPLRGSAMAAWRLLRCNPWSPGGIDHVPPSRTRGATSVRSSGDAVSPDASGDRSQQSVQSAHSVQQSAQSVQQSGVRDA